MRIIISILFGFRNLFRNLALMVFNKSVDPVTGKIKFLKNPHSLKRIVFIAFVVFLAGLITYKMLQPKLNFVDGKEGFKSELENKIGVTSTEYTKDGKWKDPLYGLKGVDPLSVINNSLDGSSQAERGNKSGLTDDECEILYTRYKTGADFSAEETQQLKDCMDDGQLTGLSPEELALLRKLLEGNDLSDEERALLKRLLNDELDLSDPDYDIAKALLSTNPIKKQRAQDILKARAVGDEALSDALYNKLINAKLTPEEKALLSKFNRDALNDAYDLMKKLQNLKKDYPNLSDEELAKLKKMLEDRLKALMKKAKGIPLTDREKKLLADLAAFKKQLEAMKGSGGLSDAEKELLRRLLNGELDPSDPNYQKALDLLRKMNNGGGLSDAEKELLRKLLNGELDPSDPDYQKALDLWNRLNKRKSFPLLTGKGNSSLKTLGTDKAQLEGLMKNISNYDDEISDIEKEMARIRPLAELAAKKLANGQELTAEEMAALKKLAELQDRLKALREARQKALDDLARKMVELQRLMDEAALSLSQMFPDGLDVGVDFAKCSEIKPFKIVRKIKKKHRKRKYSKTKIVDPSGRELTKDQLRLLKLYRKEKEALAKSNLKIINPLGKKGPEGFLTDTVAMNRGALTGGRNAKDRGGINSLFISQGTNLKQFNLSPELPVPAQLMTQILVSDKGGSQTVRVKILADVYEPGSARLVIPKNAIAYGNTSSFDADTGLMNITLDRVYAGGKKIEVAFSMSSADLSPGLKGEVRDTRGKHLFGTFVSAFSSGALAAISQNYVQPYTESDLLADSLIGAGLGGGVEVANKIAELYAGDLQQAAKVFYVPGNIRVILYSVDK